MESIGKHIGIVGGLSPESTISYYKLICDEFNQTKKGLNFPQITIRSINLQDIAEAQDRNDWDQVADTIVDAIYDLRGAGADFAAIATNTPHNAFDKINEQSPLDLLSIMDATAIEIQKDNFRKVGLLGTKQTMEYGFFQRTFVDYGIETVIPEKKERDYVNRIIWDELVKGKITKKAKEGYRRVIGNLTEQGAEGIILGCTEIPLLIKQEDSLVKVYDTATIHARAILAYALE